jgi:hypothetical protein
MFQNGRKKERKNHAERFASKDEAIEYTARQTL